jgi:preprotein translocase subunit SecG
VLLVCVVLIQSEEGGGMGGLFGNAGSAAFGSRSGSVMVKTTYGLVALFFVTSFILAFLNRVPAAGRLDPAVLQATDAATSSWLEGDAEAGAAEAGAGVEAPEAAEAGAEGAGAGD